MIKILQLVADKAMIIIIHKVTPARPHQLQGKHIAPPPQNYHTNLNITEV